MQRVHKGVMVKKLLIILATLLLITPLAGQQPKTINISHLDIYMKSMTEVVETWGEPAKQIQLTEDSYAFIYNVYDRPEQLWVTFGLFSKWYPQYPSWQSVFKDDEFIAVSVTYFATLPGGEELKGGEW